MKNVGRHLIIEFWDCQDPLHSEAVAEKALRQAVEACGATLLDLKVHKFAPQGISAMAIITESHMAIHTWPELNYIALDIFTCGDSVDPDKALQVFKNCFQPKHLQLLEIRRGVISGE